jgi:type VI secretion system protein ImpA
MIEVAMSILDVEKLLAPISDEHPCGQAKEDGDIGQQNEYYSIREAITSARGIEAARRELEEVPPGEREDRYKDYEGRPNNPKNDPHWRSIAEQCVAFLGQRSKDAQVLQWLIESSSHAYGYRGFIDAVEVTVGLIQKYAEGLYPRDAEDPGYALSFIAAVCKSSAFLESLKRVPVAADVPISFSSKRLADILQGGSVSASDRESWENEGARTYDAIRSMLADCDSERRTEFLQSLEGAIAAAVQLDELLQDRGGKSGYRFSPARDQLQSVQSWFLSMMPSDGPPDAASSSATESSGDSSGATSANATPNAPAILGALATRQDALNQLLRVSDYFRKTEPHSPLSYALEQAVRWGKMQLPDLLEDLIDNREVLSEVYRRMGILEKERNDE